MSIGENAELKKQLTSLSLSMDFERSLEVLDTLLKENITGLNYPILCKYIIFRFFVSI